MTSRSRRSKSSFLSGFTVSTHTVTRSPRAFEIAGSRSTSVACPSKAAASRWLRPGSGRINARCVSRCGIDVGFQPVSFISHFPVSTASEGAVRHHPIRLENEKRPPVG